MLDSTQHYSPCAPLLISISISTNFFSGAELVDSVLDVVRKEAESCDCLQVRDVITFKCGMSILQHVLNLVCGAYLLPGPRETFSFTPNVTGAGCHGG